MQGGSGVTRYREPLNIGRQRPQHEGRWWTHRKLEHGGVTHLDGAFAVATHRARGHVCAIGNSKCTRAEDLDRMHRLSR